LGAFALDDERLASACARMDTTADLETSRQAALEIQAILMEKLPMVPLYQVMRYEAARNVVYPFDSPLDGFSGMYGAPWLAVPAQ
jgi:ABC-type oligopeptide transport system substrate-binding subunit